MTLCLVDGLVACRRWYLYINRRRSCVRDVWFFSSRALFCWFDHMSLVVGRRNSRWRSLIVRQRCSLERMSESLIGMGVGGDVSSRVGDGSRIEANVVVVSSTSIVTRSSNEPIVRRDDKRRRRRCFSSPFALFLFVSINVKRRNISFSFRHASQGEPILLDPLRGFTVSDHLIYSLGLVLIITRCFFFFQIRSSSTVKQTTSPGRFQRRQGLVSVSRCLFLLRQWRIMWWKLRRAMAWSLAWRYFFPVRSVEHVSIRPCTITTSLSLWINVKGFSSTREEQNNDTARAPI